MFRGITEVFPLTATRVPLWKFLAILESRVQDVGRAAPWMEAAKMTEIFEPSAGPLLLWGQIVTAGKVVPDVYRVLEGERPELQVIGARSG